MSPASFKRGCLASAQHDVETIAERPVGLRALQIEFRNEALPRAFVGNRLPDWIVLEQRIAGKIHLRNQSRCKRRTEQRKMNMRRPPRVLVVLPRIRPRLDRGELIAPLIIGKRSPRASEIRVEGRVMIVFVMAITA